MCYQGNYVTLFTYMLLVNKNVMTDVLLEQEKVTIL